MRIPFANRMADIDLPVVQGQPKATVKSVIDVFREQVPNNFEELFEAFVFLSPRKVRVTCRSARALEDVCNLGLEFRNSPVVIKPCRSAKWVNVTRLSYGVPNDVIIEVLRPYGKIHTVKMDVYQGVYVGVRNVLMDISTPIPSSLRIADHWCNIFYPGQVATCFACHESGHTRANCPAALLNRPAPAVDAAAVAGPELLPEAREDIIREMVGSVVARVAAAPADGPVSYAAVVTTGHEAVVPVTEDSQISEDGHAGLPLNDDGLPPSTTGVPKIASADLVDPLATDDGHHSVSAPDRKPSDLGHINSPAGGALKITSPELVAPLATDDGHHSASVTDHQPSDLGQTGFPTVDPPSVIPGVSKPTDEGQLDQHPPSDGDSLSSSSTSDIKGIDSQDADADDDDDHDNDDFTPVDEHFEDAQAVLDSYEPAKRDHSSGSSSDASPQRKRGKLIGARLLNLAMAVPVPSDDDDDVYADPQDPNLNNPHTPAIVAESHSLPTDQDITDYPLTQPTPDPKPLLSASQSASSGFELLLSRKKTGPRPVFGTHRLTKKPSSRGASDL